MCGSTIPGTSALTSLLTKVGKEWEEEERKEEGIKEGLLSSGKWMVAMRKQNIFLLLVRMSVMCQIKCFLSRDG